MQGAGGHHGPGRVRRASCPPGAAFAECALRLAFDARGGRLGYGGGFYDALLGGLSERPPLIAAAIGVQVVERVPTEEHDVLVDLVVTETGPVRG